MKKRKHLDDIDLCLDTFHIMATIHSDPYGCIQFIVEMTVR